MSMTRRLFATAALILIAARSAAAQSTLIDSPDAQHISFPDPRLSVNGLYWFEEDKPALRRLPARLKETLPAAVWNLAQQPSGGRVRFRSDSSRVAVVASNPNTGTMHHMTTIGQSGLDFYVDGEYRGSAWPDKAGKVVKEWAAGKAGEVREVTIYLPLYKGITISEIVLDKGAKIEEPKPFSVAKPVVYYGSSITQGGCAENPGLSAQAIVSRRLNLDFVNLGFSGSGLGEPAVARAVAEIDAAAFVLDYWGNPSPEVFRDTLPGFLETIRAKHPKAPILVTSPYYFPSESASPGAKDKQDEKRRIAREFVDERRKAGDDAISYVDGLEMLSREHADGLVDGVHANSLGFYFCANGLEPHLRRALGLPAR